MVLKDALSLPNNYKKHPLLQLVHIDAMHISSPVIVTSTFMPYSLVIFCYIFISLIQRNFLCYLIAQIFIDTIRAPQSSHFNNIPAIRRHIKTYVVPITLGQHWRAISYKLIYCISSSRSKLMEIFPIRKRRNSIITHNEIMNCAQISRPHSSPLIIQRRLFSILFSILLRPSIAPAPLSFFESLLYL